MPEALKRSHDAAKAPLPVLLIVTHGAGRLPPARPGSDSPSRGGDTGHPLHNKPKHGLLVYTLIGYRPRRTSRCPGGDVYHGPTHAVYCRLSTGRYTKKGLCSHYGISRPTGLDRPLSDPRTGGTRWRRPGWHPDTTAPEIVERIIETKLAHQSFGPKKVMDRVLEPDEVWPADSTAGKILKRNHLVRERRQRRRVPPDPRASWSTATLRHRAGGRLQGRRTPGQREALLPADPHRQPQPLHPACRALSHPTTDAVKALSGCFGNTACLRRCAPTTARPLPRWLPAA